MKVFATIFNTFIFYTLCFSQCPTGYETDGLERAVNGDFDSGNSGFSSQYTYIADGPGQTELNPEGLYSIHTNPNDLHSAFASCSDPDGTHNFMIINGSPTDNQIIWEENITVNTNTVYYFVCKLSSVHPSNPAQLQFSVNGTLLGSVITASTTTCQWDQFYATWNSGANTSATISIVNQNTIAAGNDFAIDKISFVPCKIVLPIELVNWEVICCNSDTVKLLWQTASEQNNNYFTIEKSKNGVDFESVGTVFSKDGNSNMNQFYTYYDVNPFSGILYYRLSQTDIDGSKTYFKIIPVNFFQKDFNLSFIKKDSNQKISCTFQGSFNEIQQIYFTNILGKIILKPMITSSEIDISELPFGVYYIYVIFKNKTSIQRIVIL
jgi:hypothetical protein